MRVDDSLVAEIAQDWKQDPYYDRAEMADWLEPFWGVDSHFRRLFGKLDTTNLVELACGHGRHTAQILKDDSIPNPNQLSLLDVNQENITYCRKRFVNDARIAFHQNNGSNFQPLSDGTITAIFCYDAMVHFEYDCIVSYVNDAFRVLRPGGRVFFHHSNYVQGSGNKYFQSPHGRNFMSREFFSHIAKRAGFSVLEQVIIDWGEGEERVSQLDCLSLIEKPSTAVAPPPVSIGLLRRIKRRLKRILHKSS